MLSQLIREDIIKLEQPLDEGPLRNLGMAATVAAGLMGNPAQAQSAQAPAYATSQQAPQSLADMKAQVQDWWSSVHGIARNTIVTTLGNPDDYVRQARRDHGGAESYAANFSNSDASKAYYDWYLKAAAIEQRIANHK